ncbi:phage tail assembly chaperone [Vibrio lentus]|uniref:phage tail assembly chaperone n=2 Tax=Vibrio lentus TaxID=136468 RepID=UPI001D053464|nr:hypothetical protein [Vibrio lentus]MCB5464556.1 hypothetical protein [Vibrio lentus]MCC4849637.1 hypothetical protein [Vibrio lentus]
MEDNHLVHIEVKGKKYTLVRASAEEQDKILRLFKRYSATAVLQALALGGSEAGVLLAQSVAYGAFYEKASDEEIDFVLETLLYSAYEKDTETMLTLDYFHNLMGLREQILVEAFKANFQDFFDYLGLVGSNPIVSNPET